MVGVHADVGGRPGAPAVRAATPDSAALLRLRPLPDVEHRAVAELGRAARRAPPLAGVLQDRLASRRGRVHRGGPSRAPRRQLRDRGPQLRPAFDELRPADDRRRGKEPAGRLAMTDLAFRERPAAGEPAGLLVLHHGRGTDELDLLGLGDALDPEPRLHLVTPRAPLILP